MTPPSKTQIKKLVRVPTAFVPEETDAAIRTLAKAGHRPLSREIRMALEAHVAREFEKAA